MPYPVSGRVLNVGHDSVGRVNSDQYRTYINNFAYNGAGQVTGLSLGNVANESYGYDANRMQLTSQTATQSGGSTGGLMNLTYGYQASAGQTGAGTTAGNAGQLMSISGTIGGVTESAAYTYDDLGRLVTSNQSSNTSSAQRRFAYDRWGNRTGMWDAVSGGNQIQSITLQQSGGAPTNRITSVTSGSTVNYTYDAAGNVTNDGVHAYAYDSENRIMSVDNSSTASYAYDQQNRRYKKTVGSTATHYVWQGSQVLAEYNGSTGAALLDYVYSGGRIIAKVANGSTQYFLSDRLSSRLTLDSSGSVIGRQGHLPFGEDFGESGTQEKHHFTSYERDPETTFDNAINRAYVAANARFISADPYSSTAGLLAPQNWNRYSYSLNDPENLIDPLGLWPIVPIFFPGVNGGSLGSVTVNAGAGIIIDPAATGGSGGANPKKYPKGDGGGDDTAKKQRERQTEDQAARRAAELLQKKECADFIANLIQQASLAAQDPGPGQIGPISPRFWTGPPNADYALNIYTSALSSGGIVSADGRSGRLGEKITYGETEWHGMSVTLVWHREFFNDLFTNQRALMTIHESLHLVPNFNDQLLANTAAKMAGSTTTFTETGPASEYLNEQIEGHCK